MLEGIPTANGGKNRFGGVLMGGKGKNRKILKVGGFPLKFALPATVGVMNQKLAFFIPLYPLTDPADEQAVDLIQDNCVVTAVFYVQPAARIM